MDITIKATGDVRTDQDEADRLDETIRSITYSLGRTEHTCDRFNGGYRFRT
ncbi:hypothetical protein HN747_03560 [archaeon]|nr:hypothetical protein [archaeon]